MFRKKEEGWQRTFDYHKEHIYPVEQEVQRELDKEYLDFTGAQNPIKLGSLIENYMSKKK